MNDLEETDPGYRVTEHRPWITDPDAIRTWPVARQIPTELRGETRWSRITMAPSLDDAPKSAVANVAATSAPKNALSIQEMEAMTSENTNLLICTDNLTTFALKFDPLINFYLPEYMN